jgi:hypothetical protein
MLGKRVLLHMVMEEGREGDKISRLGNCEPRSGLDEGKWRCTEGRVIVHV